jgi:hypothetical protein
MYEFGELEADASRNRRSRATNHVLATSGTSKKQCEQEYRTELFKEDKTVRLALSAAFCAALLASFASFADDKSRLERAGNCKDAKSQMEYFCDEKNAASDSMVAIGTACNNAKNNVKAACEGVDTPDPEYKFEDRKQ